MIDELLNKDKKELEVKDVIDKASRIISERIGIVRNIKRTAWYNDEPKMFHFNIEMCDTSVFSEVENKSNFPGGASFDRERAFVKALGEAIERYCLGIYNKKHMIKSSYSKLGDKALDPNLIVNFSETQLKNKNFKMFKFTNNSEFRWVEGYSITDDKPIFIPAQLVYVPYNYKNEKIIRFPISTGAAAGTSISSALLRGICEVIERDAFMINYLNMLKREKVNPTTNSTSDYINHIVDVYELYKLELHTINISTDIPVYTFLTILIDRSKMGPAVTIGLKTSFNPQEAFIGSVEEAQPVRVWIRDLMYKQPKKIEEIRKRQFLINTFEERGLLWSDYSMIKYLNFWIKNSKEKKLNYFKNLSTNAKKDLKKLIKFLKNEKYNIVFVDITTRDIEEIGFKVVKVIIPEMQPLYIDERFKYLGGRRLYSVPLILGYKPKSEENFNKIPHPFL